MESREKNTTPLYDNIIFPLLRACLWGEERYPFTVGVNSSESTSSNYSENKVSETDWEAVYEELCHQTLQILPTDILCRVDQPRRQQYLLRATRNVTRWYAVMEEQQKLGKLLASAEIPFVILKGAAANYYYPQPTYRSMGDIDILVKPENFDRACALMAENAYLITDERDSRHTAFTKNKVLFELHRYFALLNNAEYASALDNMIFTAIDQATEYTLEGYTFPMLPDLENGLVLIEHIGQHLESGLGLRQIIDWMLYVDQKLRDEMWFSRFQKAVSSIGLETLAITVTRMCQLYLGLDESITWCKDADEDLCNELMRITIARGNFGRKLAVETQKTRDTLLATKSIPMFFARLQQRGVRNWTVLKKFPFLKPFAWFYQICRYIHLGLKREQPFKQLRDDIHASRKNDDIFTRLEIPRQGEGFETPTGTRW